MYREGASRVRGAVAWAVSAPQTAQVKRAIPGGCRDLVHSGDTLLVAGPDTGVHLADVVTGVRVTGLRFAPGVGPVVLGVPAHELTDLRVPLEQVLQANVVVMPGTLRTGSHRGIVEIGRAVGRLDPTATATGDPSCVALKCGGYL